MNIVVERRSARSTAALPDARERHVLSDDLDTVERRLSARHDWRQAGSCRGDVEVTAL